MCVGIYFLQLSTKQVREKSLEQYQNIVNEWNNEERARFEHFDARVSMENKAN